MIKELTDYTLDLSKKVDILTLDLVRQIGEYLNVNFEKIQIENFYEGIKIEMSEHKDLDKTPGTNSVKDYVLYGKIALAHLRESPNYYQALDKMEKNLKEEVNKTNFDIGQTVKYHFPSNDKTFDGKIDGFTKDGIKIKNNSGKIFVGKKNLNKVEIMKESVQKFRAKKDINLSNVSIKNDDIIVAINKFKDNMGRSIYKIAYNSKTLHLPVDFVNKNFILENKMNLKESIKSGDVVNIVKDSDLLIIKKLSNVKNISDLQKFDLFVLKKIDGKEKLKKDQKVVYIASPSQYHSIIKTKNNVGIITNDALNESTIKKSNLIKIIKEEYNNVLKENKLREYIRDEIEEELEEYGVKGMEWNKQKQSKDTVSGISDYSKTMRNYNERIRKLMDKKNKAIGIKKQYFTNQIDKIEKRRKELLNTVGVKHTNLKK